MDNSIQPNADDTAGASMYFSFDAESTTSNSAFKTLDNTLEVDENKDTTANFGNVLSNNTLEVSSIEKGQMKIMKTMASAKIRTPLRALQKNFLNDYNAMSSTPTQAELMKIKNKSIKKRADLKDFDAYQLNVPREDLRDYAQSENGDGSTLSLSSMSEKKISMMHTTEEESVLETDLNKFIGQEAQLETVVINKINENFEEQGKCLNENVGTAVEEKSAANVKDGINENFNIMKPIEPINNKSQNDVEPLNDKPQNIKLAEKSPNVPQKEQCNAVQLKGNMKKHEQMVKATFETKVPSANKEVKFDLSKILLNDNDTLAKVDEHSVDNANVSKQTANTKVSNEKSTSRRSFIPSINLRRSCEPNLATNRPSRIVANTYKRFSVLPINTKITTDRQLTIQEPKITEIITKNSAINNEKSTVTVVKKISQNATQEPKSVECNLENTDVDKEKAASSVALKMTEMTIQEPKPNIDKEISTVSVALKKPQIKIQEPEGIKTEFKKPEIAKENSAAATETRAFLQAPSRQLGKTCNNYFQRRSVTFKSNINSPARKLLRKSIMNSPSATKQRIMKASTNINAVASRKSIATFEKPIHSKEVQWNKRKSMFPTVSRTLSAPMTLTETDNNKEKPIIPASTGAIKKENNLSCNVCSAKFRIKSLLDAHKRSHEDTFPPTVIKRTSSLTLGTVNHKTATKVSTTNNNNNNNYNNNNNNSQNQCKFCDKKFALARALNIHLMVNCSKIPPSEKRKLDFIEMKHVEKAQLPLVFHNTSRNNSVASSSSSHVIRKHSNLSSATASEDECIFDKSEVTVIVNELSSAFDETAAAMMPPTTSTVKKTKIPGMYRTPKKSIKCHMCNENFKSVLEYTEHSLANHLQLENVEDATQSVQKVNEEKEELKDKENVVQMQSTEVQKNQ